jgi:chromosomal replication initiation ATPase DnaA
MILQQILTPDTRPDPYAGLSGAALMRRIVDDVCAVRRVLPAEVMGPTKGDARTFRARAEAMAIIYATGRFSYPKIGGFFGRDHTSVRHACLRHEGEPARRQIAQEAA